MFAKPSYVHVLPDEYLTAIGDVIVSWAFFEVDLDRAIHFFRHHPDARLLAERLPSSVKQRIKLFRESAEAAFCNYPAALPRLRLIGVAASNLAAKRHELAHARWRGLPEKKQFDGYIIRDGNWGNARKIIGSKQDITHITTKINEMHFELENLLRAGSPKNDDQFLTTEEISDVRRFWADNVPLIQAVAPRT